MDGLLVSDPNLISLSTTLLFNTQVKEALVLFRTQTLDSSLAQFNTSLTQLSDEVSVLNESNRKLADNMQRWSGSFKSLLKDVIRHSDALGLLLGEEVSEFLEWPVQDHKVYSIPVLREQLALLQEQLKGHNLSISSLLAQRSGVFSTVPSVLLKSQNQNQDQNQDLNRFCFLITGLTRQNKRPANRGGGH